MMNISVALVTDNVKLTGFNNNNYLTTLCNEDKKYGQITEYPFKIDVAIKIASTHGTVYQLDMEDPEVNGSRHCLSDKRTDQCHSRVKDGEKCR